jgi:tRNA (adenine57-N1/adenine58-N1)-methyltransferase
MHQIVLSPGGSFHTHRGALSHDDLIGRPEGSVVMATSGTAYVALRPLLADFTLAMKRGATIVYPKDAAQILAYADVFPGARVLEAGAGSGALSCWLLRAIGPDGELVSFEARSDFAEIARENVRKYFGEVPPWWRLIPGELSARVALDPSLGTGAVYSRLRRDSREAGESAGGADADGTGVDRADADGTGVDGTGAGGTGAGGADGEAANAGTFDRVILDMLAPWENVAGAARALTPGGLFCAYVATTTQLSRVVEELRAHGGFFEPAPWETLNRGWHVDGLAVRPDHRMIAHTGFLVTARRLADGVSAPARRRRPAKGAHPETAAAAPGADAAPDIAEAALIDEAAPIREAASDTVETRSDEAVAETAGPLPGDGESSAG